MLGIIRKDLAWYAFLFLVMLPWPLLLIHADGRMSQSAVVQAGFDMLLTVLVAITQTESKEFLLGGYQFLRNLPVTNREIVRAKHVLPLALVGLNLAFGCALLAVFPVSEQFVVLGRGYLVGMAAVCLLLGAATYYLLYRLGAPRFLKVMLQLLPLAMAVLFLVSFEALARWRLRRLTPDDLRRLAGLASGANLALVAGVALALFVLIMRASERAKARRED